MRSVQRIAIGLAVLVALVYGWRLWAAHGHAKSPAALAELAMQAATDEARRQAVVDLAGAGSAGQEYLVRLLP